MSWETTTLMIRLWKLWIIWQTIVQTFIGIAITSNLAKPCSCMEMLPIDSWIKTNLC